MATHSGHVGSGYIGGAGLARGYLNRSELTKERFIVNPFATEKDIERAHTRLYKTGDLVRWLQNGDLEYIGRNDFQVKIRGFRIELGEIENCLSSYSDIKQVSVIVKERINGANNDKYIVAYYVSSESISEDLLITHLNQAVPDYMIPSVFVQLRAMPLTINGKLDRKALPEPTFMSKKQYMPPRNEIESSLCNIWESMLGIEMLGIDDDFFRIGGDSILSIKLSHKISSLWL